MTVISNCASLVPGWTVYTRETCRLCDSKVLEPVITLAPTPLANNLLSENDLAGGDEKFPLIVARCADCGHLQLRDIVNPERLFSHYLYVSGTTPRMVAHLEHYASTAIERLGLVAGDLVVEIGSNDGTLLGFFQKAGLRVVGVDPAKNLAECATRRGIPTLAEFFSCDVARQILREHGAAKVICANHCLAHIDDLTGIVEGVRELLDDDGELIFEVGYLLDVVRKTLFDTIYHEHIDYHHLEPLTGFFSRHGMTVRHTERHDIQGGALRCYVGMNKEGQDKSVSELISTEHEAGLDSVQTFRDFEARINRRAHELSALLRGLKGNGRRIAGYGSPAKATTLMHHFDLGQDIIDYIVDDNPLKQGRFTPGYRIPIYSVDRIYSDRPDYLLILAWNFAREIMSAHSGFRREGGRFIVPLPDLTVC